MRNRIIILIFAILALTSCHKAFSVSSVHFSRQGGPQSIEVYTYGVVQIHDGNARYGPYEYDKSTGVCMTSLDWLKVEYNPKTKEAVITAEQNDSGKKRTLYLSAMSGDVSTSIAVIQEK